MRYLIIYFIMGAIFNLFIELLASKDEDYKVVIDLTTIIWQLVMWPYLLYMFIEIFINNE